MISFFNVLFSSIGENLIIFVFAVITSVIFLFTKDSAKNIDKYFEPGNKSKLENRVSDQLERRYPLFMSLISIFPLLGMLGTVASLITLDMSGDTDIIKQNFFLALTSTAWGIIFSIIFKIVHAVYQPYIENQIEKIKKEQKK